MTQKELDKEIRSRWEDVLSEQDLVELLELINQHVAEVIGENEYEEIEPFEALRRWFRNKLRNEQRKRAGL